jgi:hypothetical protein
MTALAEWHNFYAIVGAAVGALIGLQFIVITLISDMPIAPVDVRAVDAFATPTIVHFGAVLLLSAILSAPWHAICNAAVLCGLVGLSGVAYTLVVARRFRAQTAYQPQFEDWFFHVLLPLAAYALLAASAYANCSHVTGALFGVGAAALLLLFIGIHNAWDSVTYAAFITKRGQQEAERHR